jgi:polar amino acid transport system substrate-binding protein
VDFGKLFFVSTYGGLLILLQMRILFVFLMLNVAGLAVGLAEPLTVLAEEDFPPYSYRETNGVVHVEGVAVRVVNHLLSRLNSSSKVELQPWIRAYRSAQTDPNIALFPMRRTAEREAMFHWIGVVAPYHMSVYAKSPRFKDAVMNMASAKGLRVGTLHGGYVESVLRKQGFKVGEDLFEVSRMVQNVRKLMDDRIDLVPIGELSMAYIMSEYYPELTPAQRPYPLFRFSANQDEVLYLVVSRQTPDSQVKVLREALETIHSDGTYEKILKGYLAEAKLL